MKKKISTQAKILLQYPPPKMLPYHTNHSKLHSIINQPKPRDEPKQRRKQEKLIRNVKPKENWNETWLEGGSRSDKQEIKS